MGYYTTKAFIEKDLPPNLLKEISDKSLSIDYDNPIRKIKLQRNGLTITYNLIPKYKETTK